MSNESPEPMDLDSQEPEKSEMQLAYEEAKEVAAKGDNDKAIRMFEKIIARLESEPSTDTVKWAENSIYAMADCLVAKKDSSRLFGLQKELRPVLTLMAKAKTAKIVRTLIDKLAEIDGATDLQIKACEECIEWCRESKRSFLRHRVETRLADLELQIHQYNKALEILTGLVKEVKKIDDKLLLVEIYVIETKVHFALQNIPRAKASLTAAKTNANAIHCPPLMQADMDLLSGVISCRENDYRTAYSYFYEAFEAFNLQHDKVRAEQALKYMVLSRIMGDQPGEVFNILKGKAGLKYGGGRCFEGLEKVAKAHEQRSLHDFERTMQEYKKELGDDDAVLKYHLTELNESLLEQNLLKIIEPFDRIEIEHVAKLIDLPLRRVQKKLSEMILDETLLGTLDQGIGVLVVYDELEVERVQKRKAEENSSMYDDALATIDACSNVVDSLYTKTTTMLFGNGGPKAKEAEVAAKTKGA